MDYFTLQEVVARSGLSEHTLRYYERIGLLEKVNRDPNSGHRRYTPKDLQVIEVMACLRTTGMSIENMRSFLKFGQAGTQEAAQELAELFDAHRRQIELELARKQEHLRYLELKVAFWKAYSVGDQEKMREASTAAEVLAQHITK